jgi:hypothetical protein
MDRSRRLAHDEARHLTAWKVTVLPWARNRRRVNPRLLRVASHSSPRSGSRGLYELSTMGADVTPGGFSEPGPCGFTRLRSRCVSGGRLTPANTLGLHVTVLCPVGPIMAEWITRLVHRPRASSDRGGGRHDDVAGVPHAAGQLLGEVWDCLHTGRIYRGCRNVMLYFDSVPNVEVGVLLDQPCPLIGRVMASTLPAEIARLEPSTVALSAAWGRHMMPLSSGVPRADTSWTAPGGKSTDSTTTIRRRSGQRSTGYSLDR